MSKLLTAPAIRQEHLGVCDPEFCVLPFYTLILSVASPWGHIHCDGDTLSPHQYLHSPQTLYSFPAVALVLGSPSSSPTVPFSSESPPSTDIPTGNQHSQTLLIDSRCSSPPAPPSLCLPVLGISFPFRLVCCHTLLPLQLQ